MTVFEYLQALPQDKFTGVLAGLMGFRIGSHQEQTLEAILKTDASEQFPIDSDVLNYEYALMCGNAIRYTEFEEPSPSDLIEIDVYLKNIMKAYERACL